MLFESKSFNFIKMKIEDVPEERKSLPTRGIEGSFQIWTDEKAQRDSSLWNYDQNLWFIKGKVYNLTDFIFKHPGGSHWIEYTKGQNIT